MRQLRISKTITSRSSESLDRYLAEIAKQPLISPEEEARLAQLIHQGGREGEKARDKLVNANLRFVVSVAKQYQHQGVSLVDLINEGNVGLVKAADKFDETRGFKFISYAVWWIRQSIMEALAVKGRMVRVPMNHVGLGLRITRFADQFLQENGRMPTDAEVAAATDIDEGIVKTIRGISPRTTSIDAPTGADDDGASLADTLPAADRSFQSDDTLERESLNTFVTDLLREVLSPREETIVKESFGIGQQEMSLDEIAEQLGMSRERIRQLREKAIRKIRASAAATALRQYLG